MYNPDKSGCIILIPKYARPQRQIKCYPVSQVYPSTFTFIINNIYDFIKTLTQVVIPLEENLAI